MVQSLKITKAVAAAKFKCQVCKKTSDDTDKKQSRSVVSSEGGGSFGRQNVCWNRDIRSVICKYTKITGHSVRVRLTTDTVITAIILSIF